jgi:chitodextrinase
VAALIWSLDYQDRNFDLSASDVRNIIRNTTDPIDHLNPGFEGRLGTGRVNAYKALLEAAKRLGLNLPPTATITSPPEGSTFNVGQTIHFDGSDSYDPDGEIVIYSWAFGDGVIEEFFTDGETVEHVYTEAGSYTVTLTVTDNHGATGTDSVTITVTTLPPPDLTVTSVSAPSSAKVGDTISVTFTVENRGDASAEFNNRVSLSTDPYGIEILLSDFLMLLDPRSGMTEVVEVTIPQVPPGDYYLTVYADSLGEVDESDEDNNIGSTYPEKISIVSQQLTWLASAPLSDCDGPIDNLGNKWYEHDFDDSHWQSITLPDGNWNCDNCDDACKTLGIKQLRAQSQSSSIDPPTPHSRIYSSKQ